MSFIIDPDVAAAIQWSEHLDLLFVNNYESDPTLSWQYYGATVGFLRRFPGKYQFINLKSKLKFLKSFFLNNINYFSIFIFF